MYATMDASQRYTVDQKKPGTKENISYNSTYITSKNTLCYFSEYEVRIMVNSGEVDDGKGIMYIFIQVVVCVCWAPQVALVVRNLPANAGDIRTAGSIPGLGRSPGGGHGNPFQYSCLENPMDRGALWANSIGSQRVRYY